MTLGVADRLTLSDLVHRYAAAVDDRKFADAAELFTAKAELVLPNPPEHLEPVHPYDGPEGVLSALTALATVFKVTRTEHALIGEVYTDGYGPGSARGRIACIAHHWTATDAGQATDVVWHLRYDDEYRVTSEGWRIDRRALTINAIETSPLRRLRL